MKLFIFILLIAAFLQTSFIPLNLCLIILICRSYAIHQKENYYLALYAGIFLGILSSANLGFWPLIMIPTVFIIHTIRLLPITGRVLTIIPVALLLLLASSGLEKLILNTAFVWWYPMISSIIALPIFIVIREWEERFITKKGIKLKL